MNCSPHCTIASRRWFTSAADRPAGTREALPGTIAGFMPYEEKRTACKFRARQKIDTALAKSLRL
jgi:hypothetical protein